MRGGARLLHSWNVLHFFFNKENCTITDNVLRKAFPRKSVTFTQQCLYLSNFKTKKKRKRTEEGISVHSFCNVNDNRN